MSTHILQSPQWGQFKTTYGTKAVRVGDIQYTLHKVPYSNYYWAYCGRVDPLKIDFAVLRQSLAQNPTIIAINFDVPNVIKNTPLALEATKVFEDHNCQRSSRDQFAKNNILIDITGAEDELLKRMHPKRRYNINYAKRNGVTYKVYAYSPTDPQSQLALDTFFTLYKETADRQKYYIHNKVYHQKIWEILGQDGMCHIVISYYQGKPLAAWKLFNYNGVLYYPYGGSSTQHQNLFGSEYLGWACMQFGKSLGCSHLDMWGASSDPNNPRDPWWGFTNFKLKFGGQFVEYIDSYDYVVNRFLYYSFNVANNFRWELLHLLR